jgi:hypothetical protein
MRSDDDPSDSTRRMPNLCKATVCSMLSPDEIR